MGDKTLATAYATEHGVQAICPTTGETYITRDARPMTWSGGPAVALKCGCCDAHRRTGDERDPREPQWHVYFLETT